MQEKLRPEISDVSWTRPDAMHLTLHFLGNVGLTDIPNIEAALIDAACGASPFQLSVNGLGSFGNRVIWAGLAGNTEALKNLAEAVRNRVSKFGSHAESREFNGHVTLGRARRPGTKIGGRLRSFASHEFGKWTIGDLELIRSELSPAGARYTTLFTIRLGM